MMDFIKRNAPVLIIGLVTLLIFVGIILASQNRLGPKPALEKVDQQTLINDKTQTLGKADAPITIVEFGDYECPGCGFFFPYLEDYYKNNKDIVRIAFRHFPLPMHENARPAAEAALTAGKFGKFWEYSALLFQNQDSQKRDDFIEYATRLGIDKDAFTKTLNAGEFTDQVNEDVKLGNDLGVNSTPTIYLNGEKLFFTTFNDLEAQIDQAINAIKAPQETTPSTTPTN